MLLAFLGGGGAARPELPAGIYGIHNVIDPSDANAQVRFNPNGTITDQDGASLGNWTNKPGLANGADFRVKYDHSTGTNLDTYPAGASDNVYCTDLSVTRIFGRSQTVVGSTTSDGTWTIEKISTGETDTAPGGFNAQVNL